MSENTISDEQGVHWLERKWEIFKKYWPLFLAGPALMTGAITRAQSVTAWLAAPAISKQDAESRLWIETRLIAVQTTILDSVGKMLKPPRSELAIAPKPSHHNLSHIRLHEEHYTAKGSSGNPAP